MHHAIRTVKSPKAVVSAARVEHKKQPCLAISRGRVLDIYDLELRLVDSMHPNDYIAIIVPVSLRDSRTLLMISKRGEYVVVEDGRAIMRGAMPFGLCYTRCVRSSKGLVFIADDGTVAVAAMGSSGLVFDDDLNDFNYYRTLDCLCHRGEFLFLLEDISGDVILARYSTNPAKVGIVLREKTLLRRGIGFMRMIGDGLMLLGNGRIYYYVGGKFAFESEFANPSAKSSLAMDGGLVLSMEDGEMLQISLEKRPEGEELFFRVHVLGNMSTWFHTMIHLERSLYFLGSSSGKSYYVDMNDKLDILMELENEPGLTGLRFLKDSFGCHTDEHARRITYKIDLSTESHHKFPKDIKMFAVFRNHFIVSYASEGKIYGPSMVVEKSFDEILNIHVDKHCYFNTREHLFCFKDKDLVVLEDKGIVLSAYSGDLCAVFTEERLLKIISLQSMSCIRSISCSYEISLLYLRGNLFLSTYNNEFVVLDEFLNVMHETRHETLKSACSVGDRILFGDMFGKIYEFRENVLSVLCKSDSMAEALVCVGGSVMTVGTSTMFIDLQNGMRQRCSMGGIRHVFFADQLYVCVGRRIFRCSFKSKPRLRVSTEHGSSGRMLRFVAYGVSEEVLGSAAVVRSVNSDVAMNSYLTLKTRKHTYDLCVPDELVMDGKYVSRHILVVASNVGSNASRLSMYCTKKKTVEMIYECTNQGAVYSFDVDRDHVVTHRGNNLCVYKRQARILVELCMLKIDFTPYRISVSGGRIACACPRRSFGLFLFNQETNHLSQELLFEQKVQIECIAFVETGLVAATTDGRFLFLDENFRSRTFLFGERVTSIEQGSLSLSRNNTFYFTTENDGLGILMCLDLSGRDLEILTRLEDHANDLGMFTRERSDAAIDMDAINSMKDRHLDRFASENKCCRNDLIELLDRINAIH